MARYFSDFDVGTYTRALEAILDDSIMCGTFSFAACGIFTVHSSVDEKERRLDEMASAITRTIFTMHTLHANVRAGRNTLISRATRFSDEVITNIMLSLDNFADRLAASQVCRRWREASQHPRIWSDILIKVHASGAWEASKRDQGHCYYDLGDQADITSTVHRLAQLLERSASAPVNITFDLTAHCYHELDSERSAEDIRRRICDAMGGDSGNCADSFAELFPWEAAANPMVDILRNMTGASDRLASLTLTVGHCSTWLLLLACLPPMPSLKSLVVQLGAQYSPDALWEIARTAKTPALRVSFPALEILRISGIPGKTYLSERDSRLHIVQSRVIHLLSSLPRLKSMRLSMWLWPCIDALKPKPLQGRSGHQPASPRAALSHLKDIFLCSESRHAERDCEAFDRLMDVLPINPGCSLRYETQGEISSYGSLLRAFAREQFRPTGLVVTLTLMDSFASRIDAVDDDGNTRSVMSHRPGIRSSVQSRIFRWSGHLLQPYLSTERLRTLTVSVSAWNVLANGLLLPALEHLTFILSAASVDPEKFSPCTLHIPRLCTVAFEAVDEPVGEDVDWEEDEQGPGLPLPIDVTVLAALLEAVHDPSGGKIQRVTISETLELLLDPNGALDNFAQYVVIE